MPSFINGILGISAAVGLYDWWARRHLTAVHDTLVQMVELRGGETILDVGGGTGALSSHLMRRYDGLSVHTIDVSARMTKVAKARLRDNRLHTECVVGTVVDLPYPDGNFDVVLSCVLFHLLQDSEKEAALREIFRVLKPGGRYVCAEFKKYPAGFFRRRLLEYPSDLSGLVGFDTVAHFAGPTITRCRPIIYRSLMKPLD